MSESGLKNQLIKHLEGGNAFKPLDEILDEISFDKLGERPYDLPYSFYELFYHIVYAQKDIFEFSISEDYKAANWPDDYWPEESAPKTEEDWEALKKNYFKDRKQFKNFILNSENELESPVKNSDKHSLHREILLVIEHTAYHTGQMLVILRLLGLHK